MSLYGDFFEFFRLILEVIGAIASLLAVLKIFNPELLEKLVVWFYKILSFIFKQFDKYYLEKDLRVLIRESASKLYAHTSIMPFDIRIYWAEEDLESYLDRGMVIIRMKYSKNRAANMAKALLTALPYMLPAQVKSMLDQDLMSSLTCIMARNIAEYDPEVVKYLYDIMDEEVQKYPHVKDLMTKLENIDEQSLFSRILLPEIVDATIKAYPRKIPNLREEILKAIDMLYSLVTYSIDRPVLRGRFLDFLVVRVAKPEKVLLDWKEPYIAFIKRFLTRNIYVIAAGKFAGYAPKVSREIVKKLNYEVVFEDKYRGIYKGQSMTLYCAKLKRKAK